MTAPKLDVNEAAELMIGEMLATGVPLERLGAQRILALLEHKSSRDAQPEDLENMVVIGIMIYNVARTKVDNRHRRN